MFEVTKNCNFFPRSLEVCKNWINLIWAVMMLKFKKYFYFSCNSCFGTFILVFPYHGNVVLLFRENGFLIISFSKSENTQNIPTIPTFHDLNSYFFPTFSKFWALLYPYFFTGGRLKAWMYSDKNVYIRVEFNKFIELGGLTHRLEDDFNIIFQYNPPLLQCNWPTFLLSSLCLWNKSRLFGPQIKPL